MASTNQTAQAVQDERLPVGTLREAAPHLRRPFSPAAIKFKVQSVFKDNVGCLVVAYVDARLVVERLNAVIPDGWSATYHQTPSDKFLLCRLTVDGVTREDVGESPKGFSKDLYSDALKRAAVHFGVAVSVYALPQITLFMKDARGRIEVRGRGLVLTEKGHDALRAGYSKWLEATGVPKFGPVLDHGDSEGQTVDPEAESEGFAPEPPAALDDEQAAVLIQEAKDVYAAIREIPTGAVRVPPGTFNGWLQSAAHSHSELERLVRHLGTVLTDLREQNVAAA